MNNAIDTSIVIPVKNGEKYIGSLLKAIFSQEVDFGFEVIIVDSGSQDKTIDIIMQYPIRLYQIKPYEFNHGLTRNFGVSMAKSKYVVLMTQDAVPYDNHWLAKMVKTIDSDENIAGVYSKQMPYKRADVLMHIIAYRSFAFEDNKRESKISDLEEYHKLMPEEKHRFCNFDNVSSCIRKLIWGKYPFPKTDFGEDIEWAKRVLAAGYKIIYEPDSIVYHSHDYSISGWYKRNCINSYKLAGLFGIRKIDNIYKLFAYFFIYTIRYFYSIFKNINPLTLQFVPGTNCKVKNKKFIKGIFPKLILVPFYSFAEVFGQYKGIRGSKC